MKTLKLEDAHEILDAVIKPGISEPLRSIINRADEMLEVSKEVIITDEATKRIATEIGKTGADILKQYEEMRKEATKPLLDRKKQIDDLFKNIAEPVGTAVNDLRKKISDYAAELEHKRLAELQRIEAERRKAEAERIEAEKWRESVREKSGIKTDADQIERDRIEQEKARAAEELKAEIERQRLRAETETKNVRAVWKFVVEDADRVPREYCAPVDKLIRESIQKNPNLEIPGVRKWQEKTAILR